MRTVHLSLAAYIFVMNVFDVITTDRGLGLGAVEINPLAVDLAGTSQGTWLKMSIAFLALVGLLALSRRSPWSTLAVLIIVSVAISLVVVSNMSVIRELECEQVRQAWLQSGDPHLDWSTVEGCDGL